MKLRTKTVHLLTALAGLALAGSASAATIVNPTLGTEIDPTGGEEIGGGPFDVSFGTAQATLEARSDLSVLQDFTGFVGSGTNGGTASNVVSFTDPTRPDILIEVSNSDLGWGGVDTTFPVFATSAGSALGMRNAGPGSTSVMTITFGSFDGTNFTGDQTVAAAGFALPHVYTSKSGVVTFRDSDGTALTGASFNYVGLNGQSGNPDHDGKSNHRDIYFGWDSDAEATAAIGSIQITFVDSTTAYSSGFDDLGFTSVPEPSSFASWISDPAFGLDPADQDFGDDPDGDGLDNGLEGFFGTDPGVSTQGLTEVSKSGNEVTFTHPNPDTTLSDVTGSYEWSLDLITWYADDGIEGDGSTTVTTVATANSPEANVTTVTCTLTGTIPAQLFVRAVATTP